MIPNEAVDRPAPSTELAVNVLETVLDVLPDAVFVLFRDGTVIGVNEAARELVAARAVSPIGRHIEEVLFRHPFDNAFIAEAALRGLTVWRTYSLADGRKLLMSARAIKTDRRDGVVLTVRDVSSLDALVQHRHASQATGHPGDVRRPAQATDTPQKVIAKSAAIQAVRARALQYAAVDSPVLLLGETGTGKSLFARIIHDASPRLRGPFRAINCGALPEGLVEAELFGYARGAFTGADVHGKPGLIELADGGTLLLDEIGDLPAASQVKLLHFLESGEVWAVGASRPKRPNVRTLAATNRDLGRMIEQGVFRRDLFYRLNVLQIVIPPLREHPEDIPPLIETMLERLACKLGRRSRITPEAMARIACEPFPGNVRELWNLVEGLVVTASAVTIGLAELPFGSAREPVASVEHLPVGESGDLKQTLQRIEAGILRDALCRFGTQAKAARHLGVGQATIARKSKQYGLTA